MALRLGPTSPGMTLQELLQLEARGEVSLDGAPRRASPWSSTRSSTPTQQQAELATREVRAARAAAEADLAEQVGASEDAERKIAELEQQIAAMRAGIDPLSLDLSGVGTVEKGGRTSPRAADCHGPNDAFSRSVNERMEYELPELLQCSRKLKLELTGLPGLSRIDLMEAFEWRRIHYDGQWVVLPSLTPEEVARVDEAGAAAIHEPTSPRAVIEHSIDAPGSFLGIKSFRVRSEGDPLIRPLHEFHWRRLFVGSLWICVPSLSPEEAQVIAGQLHTRLARGAYAPGVAEMVDDMSSLSGLLEDRSEYAFMPDEVIEHVVMIIVVEAEVAPILARLNFREDEEATANLMGLARVRTGMCGSYKLSVLKVAESKIFHRHFSGYTQASAVAALAARLLQPNLIVRTLTQDTPLRFELTTETKPTPALPLPLPLPLPLSPLPRRLLML